MDSVDFTQALSSQASMAMSQNQGLAAQKALSSGSAQSLDLPAARKAAESFEAVFLSQMFGHMFEGVGDDSMFGGGSGESMFRPMLLDEYCKMVAKKGGIGIADSVMHTLISQQEKAS